MLLRATACLLLVSCAGAEVRESVRAPPAAPGARARYTCQKMADDLRSATGSARILGVVGRTGRLYADEEALEPLRRCGKRLRGDRPRVRVISHAYGVLVRDSRLFSVDDRLSLLLDIPLAPVRAFWTARVFLDDERPREAARALRTTDEAYLALELVRAQVALASGDPGAAELAIARAGGATRFTISLELGIAISLDQTVRADRALASLAAAPEVKRTKEDADGLALIGLRAPAPDSLACEHGRLRMARGDREGALERLRAGACETDIAAILIDAGRPFDALVHLRATAASAPLLSARALVALAQPRTARALLALERDRCHKLAGPSGCTRWNEALAAIKLAPAATPPTTEPEPAIAPTGAPILGAPPVALTRDELAPFEGEQVIVAVRERTRGVVVIESGEAPGGLYAFLLNGARRRGPYHLGLSGKGRFKLNAVSSAPLFDATGFNLDARDQDEGGRAVVLHVDTQRLTRDTDRDGWTDLLERAIGTSPAAKDSDGDGLKDPVDPLPLQPAAKGALGDALLRAALPELYSDAEKSMFPAVRYIQGSLELLAGAQLNRPLIALPPERSREHEEPYAVLSLFALDETQERGVVEIRRNWRAVRTLYRRQGDSFLPLPSDASSGKSAP